MSALDFQLAIIRAEASGFFAFAQALRTLYAREHPIRTTPAKEASL